MFKTSAIQQSTENLVHMATTSSRGYLFNTETIHIGTGLYKTRNKIVLECGYHCKASKSFEMNPRIATQSTEEFLASPMQLMYRGYLVRFSENAVISVVLKGYHSELELIELDLSFDECMNFDNFFGVQLMYPSFRKMQHETLLQFIPVLKWLNNRRQELYEAVQKYGDIKFVK